MKHLPIATVLASGLGLAACNSLEVQDGVQGIYTVGGAAVGGLIGSGIAGQGHRTQGAAIGAVVGGLVGYGLSRYLEEQDRRRLATATERTVATGESQTWRNSETRVAGRTEVVKTSTKTKKVTVPVLKDRVAQVPPLDMNQGGSYRATSTTNVRGGPGTDYQTVGRLAGGEIVDVIGQVQGASWYMIQQNGVGSGFVTSGGLTRASSPATTASAGTVPRDQIATRSVTSTTECRTVKQTIVLADGSEKAETVTACQGPNGWEVS